MALEPAAIVQTAIDALQALENVFARSIAIAVVNNTEFTLNLFESDFSFGGFQPDQLPSSAIPPQNADVFGTTNTDPATGVDGRLTYTATDADGNDAGVTIFLQFDNPVLGHNTFGQQVDVTAVGGVPEASFSVLPIGSVGNNCQVKYVITSS
jgi:hypothetical protein